MKFTALIAVCSLSFIVLSALPSTSNQQYSPKVELEHSSNLQAQLPSRRENQNMKAIADNPQPEKLVSGLKFAEGPLWDSRGFLLFSDTPADTLYKLTSNNELEVFRRPAGNPNGNTFDREKRLLTAQHDRRVTRTQKDGIVTLASQYEGKKLNSPNDIVVKSDGSIYFTDPPYGVSKEAEELGFYGVYQIKDGKLIWRCIIKR